MQNLVSIWNVCFWVKTRIYGHILKIWLIQYSGKFLESLLKRAHLPSKLIFFYFFEFIHLIYAQDLEKLYGLHDLNDLDFFDHQAGKPDVYTSDVQKLNIMIGAVKRWFHVTFFTVALPVLSYCVRPEAPKILIATAANIDRASGTILKMI